MTSPCRGCRMEYVDKNNDTCTRCAKRIKYTETLGGMHCSLPVEETDMGRGRGFTSDDDRRIMEPPTGSDYELGTEIGRSPESIWNRRLYLRRHGYKAPSVKARGTEKHEICGKQVSDQIINIKNFSELYVRLERSARENFRTPELQAMFFIHQGLMAEDAARNKQRAANGSS